jgi:S-adenosylmethionine:tRNA ribosyltransferase-isomerase
MARVMSAVSARDDTRLLVVDPQLQIDQPSRIGELPSFLRAKDVLVLNDAATLPASLMALSEHAEPIELRLLGSGHGAVFSAVVLGAGDYRTRTEQRPAPPRLAIGAQLRVGPQLTATVLTQAALSERLIELRFDREGEALWRALYTHGRPVQYAHQPEPLALWSVQTVYAARPWAAEMPSAGRPLSFATLAALKHRGVVLATLTHAAGLSATGDPRIDRALPLPERYELPSACVQAVEAALAQGGRVVAVGTSVVRALESAAIRGGGRVLAGEAVSTLRIGPSFRPALVSGLLTGVHSPEESHYDLLRAFVDGATLDRSLERARELGYRAHEFGDASLILPGSLGKPHWAALPARRTGRAHAESVGGWG